MQLSETALEEIAIEYRFMQPGAICGVRACTPELQTE